MRACTCVQGSLFIRGWCKALCFRLCFSCSLPQSCVAGPLLSSIAAGSCCVPLSLLLLLTSREVECGVGGIMWQEVIFSRWKTWRQMCLKKTKKLHTMQKENWNFQHTSGFTVFILNVTFYPCSPDGHKGPATGQQSLGGSSLLNSFRPPRTPSHSSLGGLPATSSSKLSRKSVGRVSLRAEPHKGAVSLQGETCAGIWICRNTYWQGRSQSTSTI